MEEIKMKEQKTVGDLRRISDALKEFVKNGGTMPSPEGGWPISKVTVISKPRELWVAPDYHVDGNDSNPILVLRVEDGLYYDKVYRVETNGTLELEFAMLGESFPMYFGTTFTVSGKATACEWDDVREQYVTYISGDCEINIVGG